MNVYVIEDSYFLKKEPICCKSFLIERKWDIDLLEFAVYAYSSE